MVRKHINQQNAHVKAFYLHILRAVMQANGICDVRVREYAAFDLPRRSA